jgi:hypothetical protein
MSNPLFFRLNYTVQELRLARDVEHTFDYLEPFDVRVVLRTPTAEEQAIGHRAEHAFCVATTRRELKDSVHETFVQISTNQILPKTPEELEVHQEIRGHDGAPIRLPAYEHFPQQFRSFVEGVRRELDNQARRTVSVLSWRMNHLGPHNPISTRGMEWSFDGTFWYAMPSNLHVRMKILPTLRPTASLSADVTALVNSGERGPIYHDLFREAWQQYESNPRSALVVGIAAAELAMKRCIATLVPGAEWLAINVPTPPLVRMLREYLPKLPARCSIGGQVKSPPDSVLKTILKGVTIRNELSHAGTEPPSIDTVEDILRSVRDVLWLLDYYCGYEWALSFVRSETLTELNAA